MKLRYLFVPYHDLSLFHASTYFLSYLNREQIFTMTFRGRLLFARQRRIKQRKTWYAHTAWKDRQTKGMIDVFHWQVFRQSDNKGSYDMMFWMKTLFSLIYINSPKSEKHVGKCCTMPMVSNKLLLFLCKTCLWKRFKHWQTCLLVVWNARNVC